MGGDPYIPGGGPGGCFFGFFGVFLIFWGVSGGSGGVFFGLFGVFLMFRGVRGGSIGGLWAL